MSDSSANLGLPYILPAQAQKHVTHNDALDVLDTVAQLVVVAFDALTPPGSPNEGDTYALAAAPLGIWAGQGETLATFRNGGWVYLPPSDGWLAVGPEGDMRVFVGGAWCDARAQTALGDLPGLGIGAGADSYNVLTVSGPASLLTHSGGGHQVKVNKAGAGETASLLFQSNWNGHAEMGLAGTNDFAVKVSADGGTWHTALTADGASGRVTLGAALRLTPSAEPTGAAGVIYFDAATSKLRCHDGTLWHDLF